jgi:thiol-disulfide isomerase/thioredoxin
MKRLRKILVVLGALGVVGFLARDFLFFTFLCPVPRAEWELSEIQRGMSLARKEFREAKQPDPSEEELQTARAEFAAKEAGFRQRLLDLATENPGAKAEICALFVVAGEWPDTSEGEQAVPALLKVLETATLDQLGETFETISVPHRESLRPLIPVLLRLERENPNHAYAAKLLTEACAILAPGKDASAAPEEFGDIAAILVERHAASPKLANFCEVLGRGYWSPPWAQPFEPHLRRILEVNLDRFVRCSAKIALASLVQGSGEDRQQEAVTLYEEFLSEFDGTVQYPASGIEEMNRDYAKRALRIIHSFGLGKEAPETVGVDLEGNPMTLADYRGKAVLVSFWGTWCAPCMRMIPHEIDLIERFGDERFAVVGINADGDIEKARHAVETHRIPWRSFRNERDGQDDVTDQWLVSAYPTFYLLDLNGIVRKRWIGEPPLDDLSDSIERLIES